MFWYFYLFKKSTLCFDLLSFYNKLFVASREHSLYKGSGLNLKKQNKTRVLKSYLSAYVLFLHFFIRKHNFSSSPKLSLQTVLL
uniref:Uncharacterized protein n=1 Tax=Anguilla anguilla TaxID=7936 RepID=A0A0E9SVN9_ANGAN